MSTTARKKAARLKLTVDVRRHPRRAGRLIISARCSSTCQLQVQVGVPQPQGLAFASRVTTLALTSRRIARRQTLSVNVAKGLGSASSRLRVKVTAITRSGSHATRYRTVRLRPSGQLAAQSARSAFVPA